MAPLAAADAARKPHVIGIRGFVQGEFSRSNMYSVFLYQNMVCPHEADLVRALAARPDVRITWVVDEEVLPFRAAMGIGRPDCGRAEVVVTTDEDRIRRIVRDAPAGAIHIAQGPRGGACSRAAWREGLARGLNVGMFSEPGDPRGPKGFFRRALYRAEYLEWGRRMRFVLATGQLGIDWYASAGYADSRLFRFCYVTRPPDEAPPEPEESGRGFRLVYCGQLIRRKNVDVLLRALSRLGSRPWECSIVGDGPERAPLEQVARSLGIADRVTWRGVLPNRDVQRVLAGGDATVLASAFDGWGAVVNESLMVGTPVIAARTCGAADLLREAWRGSVVEPGSAPDLANAIGARMDAGTPAPAERRRIRAWSLETIAGDVVAQYFVALMDHIYRGGSRPEAPWR